MFRFYFLIFLLAFSMPAYPHKEYHAGSDGDVIIRTDWKAYTRGEASVSYSIEGNEHITTYTWPDGYCHKQSHSHGEGISEVSEPRQASVAQTPNSVLQPTTDNRQLTSIRESDPDPEPMYAKVESREDVLREPVVSEPEPVGIFRNGLNSTIRILNWFH